MATTTAMLTVKCPLEPQLFVKSLRENGLGILKEIEQHITTTNCHHPSLKDLRFHGSLDGTSALLLASHFGELNWVKQIIDNWFVDVNSAAVYYPNPLSRNDDVNFEKIDSATALFVAAFNGHINVVRYLIEKGANLSAKTSSEKHLYYDGLSPLYGAVRHHHHRRGIQPDVTPIVRFLLQSGCDPNALPSDGSPIWMSPSCSLDVLKELIAHGLNLDQRNADGETLLNQWTNRSSFDGLSANEFLAFVQLLVEKGADVMSRDNNGFTPIFKAANRFSWNVVHFLMARSEMDRLEKIEALEMAAATILCEPLNQSEFERAFVYWRGALRLRQTETSPTIKIPLKLKSGRVGEWTTSAELELVIARPTEYEFQSFLVRLGICSSRSWGAVFTLRDAFLDCLRNLKEQGRLIDLLDVVWAMLETIHQYDSQNLKGLCIMTDDCVENLIWMLSQLEMGTPLLNADTFVLPFQVIIATDLFCPLESADRHMRALLLLVRFLASRPEILDGSIRRFVHQLLAQYSRNQHGRTTLLHLECQDEALHLPCIRLLLRGQANANAGDYDGNGPLHLLASQHGNVDVIGSAARLLLDIEGHPAHLDRVNRNRKTAAQLWIEINEMEAGLNALPEWLREPETVPKLSCLSASVVSLYKIPYDHMKLPSVLHPFVEMH